MSIRQERKLEKKWHVKKYRGIGRQYRAVKVSNITEEGFDIAFKGKEYHVNRDTYAWFLGMSDKDIKDVLLFKEPYNEHEPSVMWGDFAVWLSVCDFEDTERAYKMATEQREAYYTAHPEKRPLSKPE